MSVTQQPSFHFRRSDRAPRRATIAEEFQELEVDVEHDGVAFKCTHENGNFQLVVLWCSAILFMLFIVSIIPAMKLTLLGNALAVIVGLLVMATVGVIVQARVRTTIIRLLPQGIRIDQGTVLDREVVEIDWKDLKSVELEPVDPARESKGMQLELRANQGEAIKVLPGTGVGDLNAVRQAVLKARRGTDSADPV